MGRELTPEERASLRDKVNEICEISPQEFDPALHLSYAQEIVRTLDSTLDATYSFQFMYTTPDRRTIEFGFSEERVGYYVAEIFQRIWGRRELVLDYFWDRGRRELYERSWIETVIGYRERSLELLDISRITRTPTTFVFPPFTDHPSIMLSFYRGHRQYLWRR